jgi:hypothetical protein
MYKVGALCYDETFCRILGSKGKSELILKDLVEAWQSAMGHTEVCSEVTIMDRQVKRQEMNQAYGDLTVDVRLKHGGSNFLVEVQHRVEALFPHRALRYAAAELSSLRKVPLTPVHTLAFCDYDFGPNSAGSGLASKGSFTGAADVARALVKYNLLPDPVFLKAHHQTGNAALDKDLAERMSLTFALLPHVPLLKDLTASTPPLLRWASLVAHVRPENLNEVPNEVSSIVGVKVMMEALETSRDTVEVERARAEAEAELWQQSTASLVEEGKVKGMEEGKAKGMEEGKAKGMEEILHLLGIDSEAAYTAKFGAVCPPELLPFFTKS